MPGDGGVKLPVTVQLLVGSKVPRQLFVAVKPVTVTLVGVIGIVPLLV